MREANSGKITVFLAEDHAVVRSGLKLLVNSEPDMEVIGEARNGCEALSQVQKLNPSVIVMDVSMPELNGLEACREIVNRKKNTRVLMLTMHDDEEYFFQALRSGALGYVPKSAPESDVLQAIRCVAGGETYIHHSVAHLLVDQYLDRQEAKEKDGLNELTEREYEVLKLVAMGYSNKEIAQELSISVHTVHNHRNKIMEKLDIHDRMGLLKYALKKGLLNLD